VGYIRIVSDGVNDEKKTAMAERGAPVCPFRHRRTQASREEVVRGEGGGPAGGGGNRTISEFKSASTWGVNRRDARPIQRTPSSHVRASPTHPLHRYE
jgi:hypothetical protein